MTVQRLFRIIAFIALASIAVPSGATAQEAAFESGGAYVFVMAGAAMPEAGAGLHLAISAAKSGREVNILLMADGVDLGRKGASGPAFGTYGADGPAMLRQAMAAGARVAVCRICLRNRNIEIGDMVGGITRTDAFEVLDMLEAARVVLPFGRSAVESGISITTGGMQATEAPAEEECDPATDIDACM